MASRRQRRAAARGWVGGLVAVVAAGCSADPHPRPTAMSPGGPPPVWTGGAPVSVANSPDWLAYTATDAFSRNTVYDVAIGDVDADGATDILVSSPSASDPSDPQTQEGMIRLYLGQTGVMSAASPAQDWDAFSNSGLQRLGQSVAMADLDGDGFDDLVAGAPVCDGGANGTTPTSLDMWLETRVYYYHSRGDGSFDEPKVVSLGTSADCFGYAVRRIHDRDGDGDDELLVGAPRHASAGQTGAVYLFLGGSNFSAVGGEPSPLWWTTPGNASSVHFGVRLADAGDVFDDGTADLFVGNTGSLAAHVYDLDRDPSDGHLSVASPRTTLSVASGCASYSLFGYYVADSRGDLTGDGVDDLPVGCRYAQGSSTGGQLSVFGKRSPTDATLEVKYSMFEGSNTLFGTSIEVTPDYNGDGYPELLAGWPMNSGSAHFYGSIVAPTSGAVSFQEVWSVQRPVATLWGWGGLVRSGGDFNADGYADLLVASGAAVGIYFAFVDTDHDGFATSTDCDDSDAGRNPLASEVVGDGIDQNCDGVERCWRDVDLDGVGGASDFVSTGAAADVDCADPGESTSTGDCEDSNALRRPGAVEVVADGVDQDCDFVDSCYTDADNDNVGTSVVIDGSTLSCTTGTGAPVSGDCADDDPLRNPNLVEVVNDGIDQDCDLVDACYLDGDGDNYGVATVVDGSSLSCTTGVGAPVSGDCDDGNAGRNPGLPETVADGIDQDCDLVDACYEDLDGDGVGSAAVVDGGSLDCRADAQRAAETGDCDDGNVGRYSGLAEIVGDGVDQDCDNVDRCYVDSDNDGFGTSTEIDGLTTSCVADLGRAAVDGDCADSNAAVNPSRTEVIADGVDQNCDDKEACYLDADLDGYGVSTGVLRYSVDDDDCADDYESVRADDCADDTRTVHPDADEVIADGVDQDCDGRERCYGDGDGDGAAGPYTVLAADDACDDAGEFVNAADCADDDPSRYPGAFDLPYDGIDQDCSGADARDLDGDGASDPEDCDDTDAGVNPLAVEAPNGVDDDCDGAVDEGTVNADDDGDGYSEAGGDCNDADPDVYPSRSEVGDGSDDDCDETADEGTTRYDDDGDGFAEIAGDCDDADDAVRPTAVEIVNGRDDDCDGSVDEGTAASDDDGDGFSENEGDCDDTNSEISPLLSEVLGNAVDDDCDGRVDGAGDPDGDGRVGDEDCNEQNWTIHVGALEVCGDGVDQDCSGEDAACDDVVVTVERGGCSTTNGAVFGWGGLISVLAMRRRRCAW